MKIDMDWIENGGKITKGGLKKQNYNLSYWLTNGFCLLRPDAAEKLLNC